MELVYGQTVKIPGDLVGGELSPTSDLPTLLDQIRMKTFRPPVQTAHHSEPAVHLPTNMSTATHVYVRRGKVTPLGPRFHGPYPITARQGNSCIEVKVGNYANGTPRLELHHWRNVKIDPLENESNEAQRPALGRPKSKMAQQ